MKPKGRDTSEHEPKDGQIEVVTSANKANQVHRGGTREYAPIPFLGRLRFRQLTLETASSNDSKVATEDFCRSGSIPRLRVSTLPLYVFCISYSLGIFLPLLNLSVSFVFRNMIHDSQAVCGRLLGCSKT